SVPCCLNTRYASGVRRLRHSSSESINFSDITTGPPRQYCRPLRSRYTSPDVTVPSPAASHVFPEPPAVRVRTRGPPARQPTAPYSWAPRRHPVCPLAPPMLLTPA